MFSDKLTKAIAEAAKTVMDTTNETWPDAASTSIYADKAGKAPISDMEAGMDHQMTDEEMHDEEIQEALKKSQPASEWITDFVNSKDAKFKGKSKGERINMALGAYYAAQNESVSESAQDLKIGSELRVNGKWCVVDEIDGQTAFCSDEDGAEIEVDLKNDDFDVIKEAYNSNQQKFIDYVSDSGIDDGSIGYIEKDGKVYIEFGPDEFEFTSAEFAAIKKELKDYEFQAESAIKEGVEEPRSQGEKNFKAAHTIVKMADPNADRQTGTEAMDQKAKPVLPIGKSFSKAEDIDGEKYNDKDFANIKASGKRATAPKASAPGKFTYADGCDVYNKTAAAIKKSAQGAASAPKASGSKQSGAQSAEKVSNTAPNGKLSAEYPKANQKGSEAMPKGLKETALATLLGEDAIEEGLFDNIKALGSNVAGAVKSKVAAVGQNVAGAVKSKVAAVGQKIGDEIDKATKQGNAAELARLQARANQLKTNLPADHADAPAGASVPQYKSDPKAFVAQTTKNLADKNTTSDEELLSMLKNCLGNPTQGAAPLLLPIIQAEIKKRRVADMTKDLADKNITSDEKLFSTLKNWQGNPLMLPIIQAEIKKRGLKAGTPVTGAASAAAKPVSGAAAVAQKAALAKLTKMSTSQLQASLARIQGLLKQRGVMEEVSFDEAFELLGEEAINEAMTNFDKQFADDNEKALKSILTGQGTDDIECHGQPKQKVLVQLNKFIASYGDELKKYFSLPIEETEVNA